MPPPSVPTRSFSRAEVASHNKDGDLWIIIDAVVYDVSDFAALHPGGESVLLDVAGKDCTDEFYGLHRHAVLQKFGPKYAVGVVSGESPKVLTKVQPGDISRVPYAESSFWMGSKSPYYNETHIAFRKAIRHFVDTELRPHAQEFEENGGKIPIELYQAMGRFGFLAARIGPGPHLKGLKLPGGILPEQFDYFHELIAHEETAALGSPAFSDGLGAGFVIGLPPVLAFGSKELIAKVAPQVLLGNKRICLSITEPTAGSDVANIACTARKTPDGKHYIVNGVKKWITNGHFADYFVTAVRTGPGMGGISVLLIERGEGLGTKPIKTSYSSAAGTAYVTYDNVKVPVENLIGKEGGGFPVIMFNFNHERWAIICAVNRSARLVAEESFKWAHNRKVFGKSLIEQPVIRFKFAKMFSQIEAIQSWLENITYNMTKMSYKEQSATLAGPIALLKYQATRVAHEVSDEACQIFGGRAITKTGMGSIIESFQRTYKYGAILGGSEEIMADLGVRMAMKAFPKDAKL
ncbi:acyl-CoA dehydrogenase/oxidase [Zopfochytrium polystomum]|nr:acyl-CoA dehydrogenase/oxidase [Zopfochytrium polystomum]